MHLATRLPYHTTPISGELRAWCKEPEPTDREAAHA
jgi:hypothetical protein